MAAAERKALKLRKICRGSASPASRILNPADSHQFSPHFDCMAHLYGE